MGPPRAPDCSAPEKIEGVETEKSSVHSVGLGGEGSIGFRGLGFHRVLQGTIGCIGFYRLL